MNSVSDELKTIIIFGGTSDIVQKCVLNWLSKKNYRILLVGRNHTKLERIADDLKIRFPLSDFEIFVLDFYDSKKISNFTSLVFSRFQVHISLVAHGTLSNQSLCENDLGYLKSELENNGLSVCLISESIINEFSNQGHGSLAVIGSVAGDRIRKSNYTYGSAKSLIESYIGGLQHRFHNKPINISLIKPGPTRSSMTENVEGSINLADIDKVAATIVEGINGKKNIIYAPYKWKYIMLIIRLLPNFIFNRLDI